MSENNDINKKPEIDKKKKQNVKNKPKNKRTFKELIGEYKGEFNKIIWLSKEDLLKQTATVIVTSLMIGAIIASMDYLFSFLHQIFVSFFSKL